MDHKGNLATSQPQPDWDVPGGPGAEVEFSGSQFTIILGTSGSQTLVLSYSGVDSGEATIQVSPRPTDSGITVDPDVPDWNPQVLAKDRRMVKAGDERLVLFYQTGGGIHFRTATKPYDLADWDTARTKIADSTTDHFAVAMDGSGNIYVAYEGQVGGPGEMPQTTTWVHKLAPSGNTWLPVSGFPKEIDSSKRLSVWYGLTPRPSVTVAGDDVWVSLFWRQSSQPQETLRLYAYRSSDGGGTWTSSEVASQQASSLSDHLTGALMTQDGVPTAIWDNGAALAWAKWNAGTSTWDAQTPPTITGGASFSEGNWSAVAAGTDETHLHVVGGQTTWAHWNGTS